MASISARIPTTVCFCGRIIRNEEAEEGSIYCSSNCARLDSMSALCAQESFEAGTGSRMKQVLRIGRKEALAKSSHYRRMERFGIGPLRQESRPADRLRPLATSAKAVTAASSTSLKPTSEANIASRAAPKVAMARLQPAPRALRPLLLGAGASNGKVPARLASPAAQASPKAEASLVAKVISAIKMPEDDDDDASDYGDEDDDDVPLGQHATLRKEVNLCSHFSDSSFGSSTLVSSDSDSTISSMASLTSSSSAGSLVASDDDDLPLSTISSTSSLKREQPRLVHNIPCIPLKAENLKALSASSKGQHHEKKCAQDEDSMPTPKPGLGLLYLDMGFEESWRFDSSQNTLCDLLKDF